MVLCVVVFFSAFALDARASVLRLVRQGREEREVADAEVPGPARARRRGRAHLEFASSQGCPALSWSRAQKTSHRAPQKKGRKKLSAKGHKGCKEPAKPPKNRFQSRMPFAVWLASFGRERSPALAIRGNAQRKEVDLESRLSCGCGSKIGTQHGALVNGQLD